MSADAVRSQISKGALHPVYLLVGDDEWEQADLIAAFTDSIDEGFRAFNAERFYAGDRPQDAEAAAIEAARIFPMMASRRVVFLLRAERLLKPKGRQARPDADDNENHDERENAKGAGLLEAYLKLPEPLTTLVLAARDANKGLRLVKALYRQAVVVECWGLKDGREAKDLVGIVRKAEAWVRHRVAEEGRRIEADAARLLAERAGVDLGRLRGDLHRLILYAGGRKNLTRDDVETVIGAEVSQNAWAVTNAIQAGDAAEALKQLALLLDTGVFPYVVLGQLAWVARERLGPSQPARARGLIDAVFRTDLDLKTSAGDARVLLERLVVELCGAAPGRRASAPEAALRGR
jgi:DNA polymerase-3 subunit delta